jgi:hypothetical protein
MELTLQLVHEQDAPEQDPEQQEVQEHPPSILNVDWLVGSLVQKIVV